MLYLSQLIGSKVKDTADQVIGRLEDVLVESKVGVYSPLDFLLVKTKKGNKCIPYRFVESLGSNEISLTTLEKHLEIVSPGEGKLYLDQDVMDQQIVDVAGVRVVRVNDLQIGLFKEQMCVLGIDISVKGLLRRMGLTWVDAFNWMSVNVIDWSKTERVKGSLQIDTLGKNLAKLHPADLANIIEDLNFKHGTKLVGSLGPKQAASVIEEMDLRLQKIIIRYLGPERAAEILTKMSVDEVTDLLQALPQDEARRFLAVMPEQRLQQVKKLSTYPDDTAGGLMTLDFVSAEPDWTVTQAVEAVRELSPSLRSILFLYVTDKQGIFRGTVSARRLIISRADQPLRDIMKKAQHLTTLKPHYGLQEIMNVMTKYDLYTAAVVDKKNRLLGVVTIDDVMRQITPKA